MMDKLKSLIGTWMKNLQGNLMKKTRPVKWLVFSYFIMVAMLVLTYYGAWVWLWHIGKGSLVDLLAIIKEMVGASMVAFVTFVATCCVDKDGDGVPDRFENEEDKK